MSGFDGTDQEPEFDDPSYAEIRGLLADAKVTEPLPAEVATRLDEALAGLVAERSAADPAGSSAAAERTDDVVVPLRRRSRVGPRLLVAAAAVVLVGAGGVGLNQVLKNQHSDSTLTATAEPAASKAAPQVPAPGTVTEDSAGTTGGTAGLPAPNAPPLQFNGMSQEVGGYLLARPSFSRASFAAETAHYLEAHDGITRSAQTAGPTPEPASAGATKDLDSRSGTQDQAGDLSALASAYPPDASCPGPTVTDGSVVLRIVLDRKPATLVVHPETDGSQFVAAWSCDGQRLLAYTTITR